MDNFNFNLLKYFYYIAVYNGFTNASRNLKVAQPSLSLNVKKLEEELGYKLIERNSKVFKLTDEGNNLFKSIKPFFESIESNLKIKTESKEFIELNIGIRYSYSFLISPNLIDKIIEEFPNIKINIKLYSKLDDNKLKEKDYDLVIDDIDYFRFLKDVNSIEVMEMNNYFICGDELYKVYKDIKHISELNKAKLISYNPSLKNGRFNGLCYDNSASFIDIISVNESDLYFEYIRSNLGIGFTNNLMLMKYDNFNIIDVEEEIFKDKLGIAYISNSATLLRIIEIIDESIKEIIQ